MGKIPDELRMIIAWNIRDCRDNKFPGRGGGKRCAAAFSEYVGQNVSPQQWSPWERGVRTPDEVRLDKIARFFGKTVEYMRRDNRPSATGNEPQDEAERPSGRTGESPGYCTPSSPGAPSVAPPGTAESFFWLAHYLVKLLASGGVKVQVEIINAGQDVLGELFRQYTPQQKKTDGDAS